MFGLGDSGYQLFNAAAKRLFNRLKSLGAVPLLGIGLGDDQDKGGFDTALDPFLDEFFHALTLACPLLQDETIEPL